MVDDRAVFLFDGDCGFCSRAAALAARLAPSASVLPWQSVDVEAFGLTADDCDDAVQWIPYGGTASVLAGPDAVAALLATSPRRLVRFAGRTLGRRGSSRLAWPVYRLIARNRDHLPGGTPTCSLPHTDR